MASTSRLQTDPVFQALARPEMVAGVSYLYFVLNGIFTLIIYVNTHSFLMLLGVGPVVHAIGMLVCRNEPRAIEMFMIKSTYGYKSWNNVLGYHHHTNSYDVF